MGYQVGNHCYATKSEAENVYFSSVAPVIQTSSNSSNVSLNGRLPPSLVNQVKNQDSKLLKPEYSNGRWLFNGKVIQANLPQCEPVKNFKEGQEIGWLIFGVLSVMYVFVILKRLLR